MKAISIHQPWASLIAYEAKKYETRSWATDYRGPIAIHATVRDPANLFNYMLCEFIDAARAALDVTDFSLLPRGHVIATAELVGCHHITTFDGNPDRIYLPRFDQVGACSIKEIVDNELLFGDFTPGRYAWEFANVKLLLEPVPTKGKQRLWEWKWPLAG